MSEFRESEFDSAVDTFIELDLNPAKVVALYPELVAGRLAVPSERWIPLFGGPQPAMVESVSSPVAGTGEQDQVVVEGGGESSPLDSGPGVGSVKPPIGSKEEISSSPNPKSKRGAPGQFSVLFREASLIDLADSFRPKQVCRDPRSLPVGPAPETRGCARVRGHHAADPVPQDRSAV